MNVLDGGDGNDTIDGLGGNDTINGGPGNDTIDGGLGNDTIDGNGDDDIFIGGSGDDSFVGGGGVDLLDYSGVAGPLNIDLVAGTATGSGSDSIDQVENIDGSPADDTIIGRIGVNVLRGGAGNVFESRDNITAEDLRWGVGVGVMYPSPVGPLALEMGWRDGGGSLVSLSLGWN